MAMQYATDYPAAVGPHMTNTDSDVYATYSDKDFKLGLNAAQTSLAALSQLARAKLKK